MKMDKENGNVLHDLAGRGTHLQIETYDRQSFLLKHTYTHDKFPYKANPLIPIHFSLSCLVIFKQAYRVGFIVIFSHTSTTVPWSYLFPSPQSILLLP